MLGAITAALAITAVLYLLARSQAQEPTSLHFPHAPSVQAAIIVRQSKVGVIEFRVINGENSVPFGVCLSGSFIYLDVWDEATGSWLDITNADSMKAATPSWLNTCIIPAGCEFVFRYPVLSVPLKYLHRVGRFRLRLEPQLNGFTPPNDEVVKIVNASRAVSDPFDMHVD